MARLWVKSLGSFLLYNLLVTVTLIEVFWLRLTFAGSPAPPGIFTTSLSAQHFHMELQYLKTSHYLRIVLNSFISQSCEMNILERWAVFSEKLFKIWIIYLGNAFGGLDEIFILRTAWNLYFLKTVHSGIWPEEPVSAWVYRPWCWWCLKGPDFRLFLYLSGWDHCIQHFLWVVAEADTYSGSCALGFWLSFSLPMNICDLYVYISALRVVK